MTNTKRLVELALLGLQAERARIDQEIRDLRKLLGTSGRDVVAKHPLTAMRGPMTEAQKKAISQTMKKYWSRRRKEKASTSHR